ncbi:MAG: hypothetical protein ABSD78_05720 [Acidimicrobiales bacterium]|jgi:hypothetical protein
MSVSGDLGACGISVDLLEVDPKLVCRVDVRHASAESVHVMPVLVGFEVGLVSGWIVVFRALVNSFFVNGNSAHIAST